MGSDRGVARFALPRVGHPAKYLVLGGRHYQHTDLPVPDVYRRFVYGIGIAGVLYRNCSVWLVAMAPGRPE